MNINNVNEYISNVGEYINNANDCHSVHAYFNCSAKNSWHIVLVLLKMCHF